ncbi:MAG: hypothetical protein NC121_14965 [Blautia sp.]|nr:hypothetical protein [Blautia sp.]
MPDTIEELKSYSKFHEYFWNGLFVALYEPHREQYPVVSFATTGRSYYIPASKSAIKKSIYEQKKASNGI